MKATRLRARVEGRGEPRSDAVLLRAIGEGDVGALGEIYDRYAHDVWRAVERTLRASADAEDVVHSMFIKLPQIAPSYDGRSSARAWLVGIAVNISLRQRRTVGRFFKMLTSFASTTQQVAPVNPERAASSRQELRVFEAALARLAPKKRAVFTLIEIEGLATEDVARALEIPAATVRTRLHHARRDLHAALKGAGLGTGNGEP